MNSETVTENGGTADMLAAFVEREVGGPVRCTGQAPGNSHDGFVFEQIAPPHRKVLARLEPTDGPFLRYDWANEARLILQLSDIGLPVPRVLATAGADVCGTPFLTLEWIDGDVFNPQQTSKLPQTQRRRMAEEMASMLSRVHAAPLTHLPALDAPDEQSRPPEAWFAQFDELLDRLTMVDSLVLDYVRVWLQQHVDELAGETTLVHGDFRLGNLVWQSGRIAGILDWETARLGNPLFDVGWMCMAASRGSDFIMGLVSRDEFVRLYQGASGRVVSERELLLWQVVAAWVRGCTELRLLDLSLQAADPGSVDPRDLSWQFGCHRTDAELLHLIEQLEAA
jgi:aminoglycoside phosphotransferase (APT) family kinase protein